MTAHDARALLPTDPQHLLPRVARLLVGVWVVLAVGQATVALVARVTGRNSLFGVIPFFGLNEEAALGTWVATMLLMACAVLSAVLAATAYGSEARWRWNWRLLSAVFLLMSLDEVARMHDRLSGSLRSAFHTSGILHFAWIIPVGALGLVFLVVQLRFLRHLGRTGRDLVISGLVFVSGAVGFEMAEGVVRSDGLSETLFGVLAAIEELLEFAGVMLALLVLLRHLLASLPGRQAAPVADAPSTTGTAAPVR